MDDDGEILLRRLEDDWNAIVLEVNAYCNNDEFTTDELRAIYDDHVHVFRQWSAYEANKHGTQSTEALARLRIHVVTILIWKLWMDCRDEKLRRSLRDELWARCEERITMKAMEIVDRSWADSKRAERIEELKQDFYEYFEGTIKKYEPGRARLTTYIDRCARNRLLNIVERDEAANRLQFTVLAEEITTDTHQRNVEQTDNLQWIHHASESLVKSGHLKESDVLAFRARTLDGKKVVEVAAELNIATGSVRNAVRRVTDALRAAAAKLEEMGESNVQQ